MARKSRKKDDPVVKIVKTIIISIFFVFICFLIVQSVISFFNNTDLFKIKEVVRDPSLQFIESQQIIRLMGKSIFSMNLGKVQEHLQGKYPEINHLRVTRQFPDKVLISAKKREPIAYLISNAQELILDKEGVVLSFDVKNKDKLTEIKGVTLNKTAVLGKSLKYREVSIALDIIDAIKTNKDLSSYDIASVNVLNLSKIFVYLSGGLRVIVDKNKIMQKTRVLGLLLSQGNIEMNKVNYIDLRFKEPILGKK